MPTDAVRIGIVTVSDRASRGEYEDRGGPAVRSFLTAVLRTPWEPVLRVVPDDHTVLETTLRDLSDAENCALVITTGGTGPAPRDVTPDATVAVCEKTLPGFGERMRSVSVDRVPTAMLSRQVAGVRGSTLYLNLPGSPGAIDECLRAVFPAIPHALRLIGNPQIETDASVLRSHDPGH